MMTGSPLPGKKKTGNFSFGSSLALRILFVFFVSLIIPLTFHFFTMSKRDYKLRLQQVLFELEVIGSLHETTLDREIVVQENALETISAFSPFKEVALYQVPDQEVTDLFITIAQEQQLTSLFYLGKSPEGRYTTLISIYPERVGASSDAQDKFLSPEEFALLIKDGLYVHLGQDPWTYVKQLYLSIPIYNDQTGEVLGILSSGLDAQNLIEHMDLLEKGKYPFDLALLQPNGEIFVSSNPYLSLEKLALFSGENLIEDPNQAELLKRLTKRIIMNGKEAHIGLKILVPGTSFFLLIEVPEKFLLKIQREDNFIRVGSFFLFILLIGGTITFWLTFRMARPLQQLSDLMARVAGGSFGGRYIKDVFGFELNRLGEQFNQMERDLSLHVEAIKIERVAKELITRELKIGHEIQKKILPRKMPEFPGLDIAAGFTPAREVGGDFYDLYVKRDTQPNQLVIAIADASGKGISACFYSLCVRSMLRSYDATYSDLPKIIRSTNNLFCLDTGDTGMFVTAWVGIYDPSTRIIQFSSCGHHPAIIKRNDGSLIEVTTSGIALGVAPFDKVKSDQCQLEAGDWVILYTDGILDARDADGKHFGKERFFDMLKSTLDPTAEALVQRITSAVLSFSKERILEDDLTLLVLRLL